MIPLGQVEEANSKPLERGNTQNTLQRNTDHEQKAADNTVKRIGISRISAPGTLYKFYLKNL